MDRARHATFTRARRLTMNDEQRLNWVLAWLLKHHFVVAHELGHTVQDMRAGIDEAIWREAQPITHEPPVGDEGWEG